MAPETVEFRAFWRDWLESKEGREHLMKRAKQSDSLLAKLIDKVYPSPQSVRLENERKQRIVLHLGPLKPAYAPKELLPESCGLSEEQPDQADDG